MPVAAEKNPMVPMNSFTGIPLSSWTFVNTSSAICTFCSGAVCSARRAWSPSDAALVNHTMEMVPSVTRNLTLDLTNKECGINVVTDRNNFFHFSTLGASASPGAAPNDFASAGS